MRRNLWPCDGSGRSARLSVTPGVTEAGRTRSESSGSSRVGRAPSWRSKARRCGCVSRSSSTPVTRSSSPSPKQPESAIPDVLAPGLRVLFCGINPGRVSAAAAAHFANPRNDFWRLLHAAGFTPRLLEPAEQFELLNYGVGVTNAAARTTPGSGDLRKGDFAGAAERLERIASDLSPRGSDSSARRRTAARSATARSSESRSGASRTRACSSSRRPRRRTPPSRGRNGCAGSKSSAAPAVGDRASVGHGRRPSGAASRRAVLAAVCTPRDRPSRPPVRPHRGRTRPGTAPPVSGRALRTARAPRRASRRAAGSPRRTGRRAARRSARGR